MLMLIVNVEFRPKRADHAPLPHPRRSSDGSAAVADGMERRPEARLRPSHGFSANPPGHPGGLGLRVGLPEGHDGELRVATSIWVPARRRSGHRPDHQASRTRSSMANAVLITLSRKPGRRRAIHLAGLLLDGGVHSCRANCMASSRRSNGSPEAGLQMSPACDSRWRDTPPVSASPMLQPCSII